LWWSFKVTLERKTRERKRGGLGWSGCREPRGARNNTLGERVKITKPLEAPGDCGSKRGKGRVIERDKKGEW